VDPVIAPLAGPFQVSDARPADVAIVMSLIPHYRVPFYEGLRSSLADDGIDLMVVAGDPSPEQASYLSSERLAWATRVNNRYATVAGREICWQPALRATRHCRLVIVEQATRLVANYPLFARHVLGRQRLAFWGHGRNLESMRASEAIKGQLSRRVHWWFAYNDLTARIVGDLGFPQERITVVDNAIDTAELRRACAALSDDDLASVRREIGLTGDHVGVFVGAMYPAKEVPLLLRAAELVRRSVPDFELILVGTGPDRPVVDAAAARLPWVHPVGVHRGAAAAPYLRLADVALLPGAVGLGVLDAFAAGCPLITRAGRSHGPEIDYLRSGVNGVMVDDPSEAAYAAAIVGVLQDRDERGRLARAGTHTAERLTIEHMVERFAGGVRAALDTAPTGRLSRASGPGRPPVATPAGGPPPDGGRW
jgi:L-malate glycosyltransferase